MFKELLDKLKEICARAKKSIVEIFKNDIMREEKDRIYY